MDTANTELYPLGETDYAVPPGETLREVLDDLGMTQRELSRRTGLSPKHVNQLIQGLVALSADVAMRLERVTGVPARMWNRLEADYRSDQQRIRAHRNVSEHADWLKALPVRELVRRGALPEAPKDKLSRVEQMLSLFGVASVEAWGEVYAKTACAFRQSTAFEVNKGAVASWLRLGELAARDIRCEPFNRDGLIAVLPELRALSVEPPEVFEPKLKTLCAAHGVAVVFVKEISGARVSGVTRWLTPHKALIQLSLRYHTDDHFWFTFFHECAHVLLHDRKMWIEDGDATDSEKEAEANKFSRDLLIPPKHLGALRTLRSLDSVRTFAAQVGVSAGIVVGRLQHDGQWPRQNGNGLKRRLDLAES